MIYVCDSIMGSGKSQAAINFMNEHPQRKFVYISPYLNEADRIIADCPELNFIAPYYKPKSTKAAHSRMLLTQGANIASTHSAFKNYTMDMLESVKEKGYTLIIDENLDILESCDVSMGDIQLLVDGGYLQYDPATRKYSATDLKYEKGLFYNVMHLFQSRRIIRVDDINSATGQKMRLFYWTFPKELIDSFQDVYILTYLFKGQSLYYYMAVNGLKYTSIGVEPADVPEGYRFIDHPGPAPEYTRHLKEKIEILDKTKLNEIGKRRTALSKEWYRRNGKAAVPKLKNNIYNVFRHIWADEADSKEFMWSTYKSAKDKVKGKGYTKGFASLNLRSTNDFRSKTHLVYACNVFPNVDEKCTFRSFGYELDDDLFALSTMVQWIWRSAIRDGKKIKIYLPSERMRNLLTGWIDSLAEGGDNYEGEVV